MLAVLEYLLGFVALAFFAYIAFGRAPTTEQSLVIAFQASSVLAIIEMAFLLAHKSIANRLIVGANIWLIAGGLAAYLQQWWWLRIYQQLGEASLFLAMLVVGLLTTLGSVSGFVGKLGPASSVRQASLILLAAVGCALVAAMYFRGNIKYAAVLPVIALSWLNRFLRHRLPSGA